MNFNQINTSREIRLWVTQIIFPVAVVLYMFPDARKGIFDFVKNKINK